VYVNESYEQIEAFYRLHGLEPPIYMPYYRYFFNIVQGNFGNWVRTTVSGVRRPTKLRYSTKPPNMGRTLIDKTHKSRTNSP